MSEKNKYSGTKTEQNLRAAFSGESEARNKYTFFASKAKKEGYEQIAGALVPTTMCPQLRHSQTFTSLLANTSAASTLCSSAR